MQEARPGAGEVASATARVKLPEGVLSPLQVQGGIKEGIDVAWQEIEQRLIRDKDQEAPGPGRTSTRKQDNDQEARPGPDKEAG